MKANKHEKLHQDLKTCGNHNHDTWDVHSVIDPGSSNDTDTQANITLTTKLSANEQDIYIYNNASSSTTYFCCEKRQCKKNGMCVFRCVWREGQIFVVWDECFAWLCTYFANYYNSMYPQSALYSQYLLCWVITGITGKYTPKFAPMI